MRLLFGSRVADEKLCEMNSFENLKFHLQFATPYVLLQNKRRSQSARPHKIFPPTPLHPLLTRYSPTLHSPSTFPNIPPSHPTVGSIPSWLHLPPAYHPSQLKSAGDTKQRAFPLAHLKEAEARVLRLGSPLPRIDLFVMSVGRWTCGHDESILHSPFAIRLAHLCLTRLYYL